MFKPILEQGRMRFEAHTNARPVCAPEGPGGVGEVVLVFPLAPLLGELRRASENHSTVEVVRVRPVAAFHLPIAFRAAPRDLPVRDAEIPQVPREVSTEFGAMIGLNPLDGHGKSATNFLDEVGGRLDGIVRIDAEDAVPGRFVDRRELVETAAAKLEVLDVDLDRLPRDMDLSAAPRPWAMISREAPQYIWPFPGT